MAFALVLKLALLTGLVSIGPTTPVCRAGVPCDRPAGGVTLTFTRAGGTAHVTTTAAGRFRVTLAPGIYTVRADAGVTLTPRTIRVRAPRTTLAFAIDTGIR
jgi:hypothetical protein